MHTSDFHTHRTGSAGATAGVLALAGLAAALMLFLDLGRPALLLWNEAREAVHALEMSRTGELLVPTIDAQPDVADAKPPLANWLGALSVHWLGENELAVRLPSALAAWATVLLITWFGARRLDDPIAGLLGGFILLATLGFVGPHMARSADLDAELVLWTTAGLLAGFLYIETAGSAALAVAALSFAAALMTKSVAALIPAPALLLHAAFRRRLGGILADWRAWLAAVAAFVPIAVFLTLRERLTPGYQSAALGVAARFATIVDGHAGPMTYYWNELVHNGLFFPWLLVLPMALAPVWYEAPRRRFVGFAVLAATVELAVLTISRTKLWWYPAPIYPIAALACGAGLSTFVRRAWSTGAVDRAAAVAVSAALFLLVPAGTIRAVIDDPGGTWLLRRSELFEMQWRGHLTTLQPRLPPGARLRIVAGESVAEPLFYAQALHLASPPMLVTSPAQVEVGDYVATCTPEALDPFEAQFTVTDVVRSVCRTVVVGAPRGPRGPDVQP